MQMSGIEEIDARQRNITIFRRKFFVSVPKNFVGEQFGISEKFSYRKTSCVRGRYHFSPLFQGLLPEKFVGEPLCVTESLGHRKLLCSVGAVSRFSVDFFGLTVLTNCVCNPFNLPENFGYRNFLCTRTENHVLQSNFFVSQYAKIFLETTSLFQNI